MDLFLVFIITLYAIIISVETVNAYRFLRKKNYINCVRRLIITALFWSLAVLLLWVTR